MKICFLLISFFLSYGYSAVAVNPAGAACFGYETFAHGSPPAFPNQALVNYNYATILARNAAIPALPVPFVMPGGTFCNVGISKMRQAAPFVPWVHAVNIVGGPLNLAQACLMAVNRAAIGINVRFNPVVRNTFPAIAAGIIQPVGAFQSFANGGYFTALAATIFNLRTMIPPPNFLAGLGAGNIPNCVILHIHLPRRVSKNVKELSFNLVSFALPGMAYNSLKRIIDNQFAVLGFPVPDSATILSYDQLQIN